MRSLLILAALAAFAVSPALAETMNFNATLSGPSETPPTDSKGVGTVKATYNSATKMLVWTVDYSGLSGPALAAHFHGPAGPGVAAPIEVPLTGSLDSPDQGVGDPDRRRGQGPLGWKDVLQHPHRRAQARRNSGPDGKGDVKSPGKRDAPGPSRVANRRLGPCRLRVTPAPHKAF